MKTFTDKLNTYSNEQIEIKEFLTPGNNAEDAFTSMAKSGLKCDGLVISGHHSGSYGGKNATSTLSIAFMEKLSCDTQYKNFFTNIKALWLQGCRTLGVEKIEADENPDFHTERVGNLLDEDNLPQNFAQLNMEFSATLSQTNPLSLRYLRIFPRATTFGWTKTAPGVKVHSEYSIPFHIANIAERNDDRARYFDNPMNGSLSPASSVEYLKALGELLDKSLVPPTNKCNRDETNLVNGWIDEGNIKKSKFSFNNPDLNAFKSLEQSNNEILKEAGKFDCYLKNSDDVTKLDSLDIILKNELLIGYNYNSIYELLQRLKLEGNFEMFQKMQNKLKSSELLQKFLMNKIASNELGILSKIDYYIFWKEMTDTENTTLKSAIGASFVKIASSSMNNDQNKKDYIDTLFQSMSKNKILSEEQIQEILNSPQLDSYTLTSMAYTSTKFPNADKLLKQIIDSNKSDPNSLASVAYAIGESKKPINDSNILLQKIIDSSRSNNISFINIANSIGSSINPIAESANLLQQLIDNSKSNAGVLSSVALALTNPANVIENADNLLQKVIDSPKSNGYSFGSVAKALGILNIPILKKELMIQQIFDSPKTNTDTFTSILSMIEKAPPTADLIEKILEKMIHSPLSDAFTLRSIATTIGNLKSAIPSANLMLQEIINSNKSDGNTLTGVSESLSKSNIHFSKLEKMFEQIITSPKMDKFFKNRFIEIIIKSKNIDIIQNQESIIKKIKQ